MNTKHRTSLIVVLVLIVLAAIPLTVWLVLNTTQLLDRRAAENEVAVTTIGPNSSVPLGQVFPVEIYLNSGDIGVSAATIAISPELNGLQLRSISFESTPNSHYDEVIYDKNTDPFTFTILSKKATANLPKGSFKIATLNVIATEAGNSSVSINIANTDVVGFKTGSTQVNFTPTVTGRSQITITGTLCRVAACTLPTAIKLVEQPRNDRKFDISISWTAPLSANNITYFYKLYRATGSPVAEPHTDTNYVSTLLDPSFIDTNNTQGFTGKSKVYYDIDSYIVCPN